MDWLTRVQGLLLVMAAYVAVTTLVRMMQRRRDQLIADVQRQVETHRKRARRPPNDQTHNAA